MIVLVVFLTTTFFYSQSIITKKFTTDDGLMANDVRTLFLDSNGLLWIGSRAGLATMQHGKILPNQDALEYRFTNIATIKEDNYNRIWIGSYGQGILIRDKAGVKTLTKDNGLISNRVRILFSYKDFVYVGTDDGISIINSKTLQIKNIKPAYLKNELFTIVAFFVDNNEVYASSLNHGIYKIKNDSVSLENDVKRIISTHYDIEKKQLLVGLINKFIVVDKVTSKINHFEIPGIRDYVRVKDKIYFVKTDLLGGNGAVYCWDGKEVENVTQKLGISDNELYTITYDKQNNFLYLGTKLEGVIK